MRSATGTDTPSPFSLERLSFRSATYEDVATIKRISDTHSSTKHFSFVAYCNRQRFEANEVLLAEYEGDVVAFAVIHISHRRKPETELDIIGVAEELRSHGVGKALLAYVIDKQPNPLLLLNVSMGDERAVSFYEKNGFTQCGKVDGKYIRMRRVCRRGTLY